MSTHNSAAWLQKAVTRYGVIEIVKEATDLLHTVDFDTIVFRGVSGALIAPIIAYKLGKEIAVIRKPKDPSHSVLHYEGFQQCRRYIIVDDLVSSGGTVVGIMQAMKDNNRWAKFAGLYLYQGSAINLEAGLYLSDTTDSDAIRFFKECELKLL